MESCLYACSVFHGRITPVRNVFAYKYFMFFLELEAFPEIKGVRLAGYEKRRLYCFRQKDHYSVSSKNTFESIREYFSANGINGNFKVYLLTNLRAFGHQFNPVSFYFALKDDSFIACIAEVGNTFGEQKLFFIPKRKEGHFYLKVPKEFYVSPYSSLDSEFEFNIQATFQKIEIRINTLENGKPVLYSRLEGKFISLNDTNLLKYTLKFPLVTIKVITMIHWKALKLWFQKVPFIRKKDKQELQKNYYKIT